MLYYIILYYIVLYCIVLYCIILSYSNIYIYIHAFSRKILVCIQVMLKRDAAQRGCCLTDLSWEVQILKPLKHRSPLSTLVGTPAQPWPIMTHGDKSAVCCRSSTRLNTPGWLQYPAWYNAKCYC